ncbi:AraC family transcriptional regulator [Brucella sp. NBRC 12950]|jgi:AraC-like DNA-binding protein|uniref:AraC family transcriptional regulator n=1 Tax=Brucella sp. NBRC 12950 TaxID=2994518 RepID=UPI002554624C|nr:AraC family transcriptional regulator [Brucella sp. NBRC 12950]
MSQSSGEQTKGFFVTNRHLPVKERTESWREAVSPLYEAQESQDGDASPIDGTIHSLLLAERLIMFASFGKHLCIRTRQWIKRSSFDYYYVQLCVRGFCFGSFEGREIRLYPGDVHIGSVTAAFDAGCSHDTATLTLMLEKDELEYACGKSDLNGTVIRSDTALGILIAELFRSSYREAGSLSFNEGVACGDALLNLLAAAMKNDHHNIQSAPSQQLRKQVLDFVNANINDPNLSVDRLLDRFSVSRSHLYRLLEADGGAASLIRKKRLQLAQRELNRQKGDRNLLIKEIAFKYGFSNVGQFARNFQQEFSLSPSEYLRRKMEDEPEMGQITRLHGHYVDLSMKRSEKCALQGVL